MTLVSRRIKGKSYYYSSLSYFLINKSRSFSRYIGTVRPSMKELAAIENSFKEDLIGKLSGRRYSSILIGKDEVIKTLLFSDLFCKKYNTLSNLHKRKYDIDSTVSFTLTTLTTEEVDVDLADVKNALKKDSRLSERERISKAMLEAVELIKKGGKLERKSLLSLHKMIMASFKTKTPGVFRNRQVYLLRKGEHSIGGTEIKYRPPDYKSLERRIQQFVEWYDLSNLNPIEKASMAHYKLYTIHPFLDGNKRVCRLIFNRVLLENGFPLINISYNKEQYFDALVDATEEGNPRAFLDFCIKQYYAQVKEFLIND